MTCFRTDPVLLMRRELNKSVAYNKTIKFMTNLDMSNFIAQFEPNWKPKYSGENALTERCFKVLKLMGQ